MLCALNIYIFKNTKRIPINERIYRFSYCYFVIKYFKLIVTHFAVGIFFLKFMHTNYILIKILKKQYFENKKSRGKFSIAQIFASYAIITIYFLLVNLLNSLFLITS